jgi:hypothetical protein
VLQNLYVLKRVAALAEGSPSFSASESQYLVNDIYRRQLLERYLADEIAVRMELIDWRGLAKAEYAQRKANFVSPEEVRVEHLLVSMEDLSFDGFVARVREVESQITSEMILLPRGIMVTWGIFPAGVCNPRFLTPRFLYWSRARSWGQ